jgi:hypothetical protein
MRARRTITASVTLLLVLATGAALAQPPASPAPAPQSWPDLSGTWQGTWGGVPASLVIFKKSEAAFVGQAVGGLYNFAQAVVGQNDGEVAGTLSTNGAGGPISVGVAGRLGVFNNRLTLVLNGRPGYGINDYQELVFTTVTPQELQGNGTSTMQWGPRGPVDLKRAAR